MEKTSSFRKELEHVGNTYRITLEDTKPIQEGCYQYDELKRGEKSDNISAFEKGIITAAKMYHHELVSFPKIISSGKLIYKNWERRNLTERVKKWVEKTPTFDTGKK